MNRDQTPQTSDEACSAAQGRDAPILCECSHYVWHHVTTSDRHGCFPPEGCDCRDLKPVEERMAARAQRSAAQPRLTFKENVVMRLIGLVILVAPKAGVRFLASVTEGVIEKIGESRV